MAYLSPIARKQRLLYPHEHPMAMAPVIRRSGSMPPAGVPPRSGFRGFGLTSSQSGAVKGASAGASAGSVIPVIGTAIGAIVGAIGGAIAGSMNKVDPENKNFQQATAIGAQNPNAVLSIANKYLVLAGLFDLRPNQIKGNIPIYKKYGRMGEQRFVTDLMTLVYQAAQSGQISASDTPQSIMVKVVQPWIDSWGFGPMTDANAQTINMIIMGMIAEYVAGLQRRWLAVGGQFPFGNLPTFSLPSAQTPQSSQTVQPSQAVVATPGVQVPAGYTLVGSGNGLPVYQGPTGVLYSLSGTTLSPFTGTLVPAAGAPPGSAPIQVVNGQPQPATPSNVSVPTGYSLIGMANGLAAYQGLDGAVYSWNGATMAPLTGLLTTSSGMSAQIVNGQPQQSPAGGTPAGGMPSLSSASQQAYNTQSAPYYPDPGSYGAPPAPATATAVTAAGATGAGLPSWLTWGAIAAAYFMFATAHPVGPVPKREG